MADKEKDDGPRAARFAKPVSFSIIDKDEITLYTGETDGINRNGMGGNVKKTFPQANALIMGQVYNILIHLPHVPNLSIPKGKIIRMKPPQGEDAEFKWDKFVAFAFIKPLDMAQIRPDIW